MADSDTGIVITQSGVPVKGAADYQKVYDSRWKFMEVAFDRDISITVPAIAAVGSIADRYYDKHTLFEHNLGFIPFFETDIFGGGFIGSTGLVWADRNKIFWRRLVSTSGVPAEVVSGRLRIYNLDVLQDYVAPKEPPQGLSSPKSDVGVKFLDGSEPGVDLEDRSPIGFSVDTTKKHLSIHRHGKQIINNSFGHIARVTAINTATDTLTIAAPGTGFPYPNDISWFSEVGNVIQYNPADFVTYPAPLVAGGQYYLIPQTSTTLKLAATREDALAGIPINLTTAGALPGQLQGIALAENAIFHDVGYPPTFLLAQTNWEDKYFPLPNFPELDEYLGAMLEQPPTFTRADKDNLTFFGVQSIFYGTYAYIILKDPAEIAK